MLFPTAISLSSIYFLFSLHHSTYKLQQRLGVGLNALKAAVPIDIAAAVPMLCMAAVPFAIFGRRAKYFIGRRANCYCGRRADAIYGRRAMCY